MLSMFKDAKPTSFNTLTQHIKRCFTLHPSQAQHIFFTPTEHLKTFSNWASCINFEPTFLGEDDSPYPSIPDDELTRISSQFLGEVERFILQYLRLPEPMLSHIKETERGNTFRIMFDSLVRWRNMQECQGENTAAILGDLMFQFAQKCLQETGIP